ncbi:MAG: tetratricopeptide repeat protein [Planctomycetota bacterium]
MTRTEALSGALLLALAAVGPPAHGAQAEGEARARELAALEARFDAADPEARFELAQTLDASGFDERALALYRAYTSQHPDDPRAWFLLARLAPADEAAEAIDRAVKLAPEDTDLLGWRLVFRLDHGREVSDAELARFEALGPSDLTGLTVRARHLLAAGEAGEGLELATALMRQFHRLGYVAQLYQRLLLAHLPLAGAELFDLASIEPPRAANGLGWHAWSLELEARATTAAGLSAWAETALVLRRHERVIGVLAAHFETAPMDLDLGRLLARALIEHGQLEAAEARLQALAELYPDDADLKIDAATAFARRGQDTLAVQMIHAARAQAPKHRRVLQSLTQIARREQRFDDALGFVETMLAADPKDTLALTELAGIHTARGEFALAAAANERFLRQRPWLLHHWVRCAQDYARGGEIARGREILALARQLGVAADLADRIDAYIDSEETKQQ